MELYNVSQLGPQRSQGQATLDDDDDDDIDDNNDKNDDDHDDDDDDNNDKNDDDGDDDDDDYVSELRCQRMTNSPRRCAPAVPNFED